MTIATTGPAAIPPLEPALAAKLAEFARACKAAARAVALYPPSHPAIGTCLGRLAAATGKLTETGPCRLQIRPDLLLIDGAAAAKGDAAIPELAGVLYRHLIGGLTVNAGADADSWRTLLLLLARSPEDVRADGGIAHLWATAGGPSLEIDEIDYAEVLRERQGSAATIEQAIEAALAGPQLQLDDSAMRALVELVGDPGKLQALMEKLERATAGQGSEVATAAFLSLLRGLADYVSRTAPQTLDTVFRQMGRAAGRLSAEGMLQLLAQRTRPEARSGDIDVVGAVVDRMGDEAVVDFVAGSVTTSRGATERLAHAFQSLVPQYERQRQLLSLAHDEVAGTELGQEATFEELWGRVESMLTSYSDDQFVSTEYGRELANARTRPVDVERASDDPPERIAVWLATVSDGALRSLDHQLLLDLLSIEEDAGRWRDVADTVVTHADDLIRVGYFEPAMALAEQVLAQGAQAPEHARHAKEALARFGRGAMLKHVAAQLRGGDDEAAQRFTALCHAIGTPVIVPLAEALAAEQDARARKRLRDILVGFGAQGRESVQQLMHAPNWEVRRTAGFLLREFGGAEGLKELVPLLADSEPLVVREAIQGLMLNGSEAAYEILLTALAGGAGRSRDTVVGELVTMRDERAAPLFCFLLRRLDRRGLYPVYLAAIESLGAFGAPEAVDALKFALHDGDWWTPLRTRRARSAAAASLRRIGTPAALDVLRAASTRGTFGVRAAARAELARLSG
jgi:HEAT repeat protein